MSVTFVRVSIRIAIVRVVTVRGNQQGKHRPSERTAVCIAIVRGATVKILDVTSAAAPRQRFRSFRRQRRPKYKQSLVQRGVPRRVRICAYRNVISRVI